MLKAPPWAFAVFFIIFFFFTLQHLFWSAPDTQISHLGKASNVICPKSEISNDVLVVLNTRTPQLVNLPDQMQTFLQCLPRFAIYSTVDHDVDGVHILDIFDEVGTDVKDKHFEFRYYDRLVELNHEKGYSIGRSIAWVKKQTYDFETKLDRWRYLPLVSKVERLPSASWYVFIGADTYLSWSNLLHFLDGFDASMPYYLGARMVSGNVYPFGNAKAGFIISRPALEKASDVINSEPGRIAKWTEAEPHGDVLVAKVLDLVSVPLTHIWPSLQEEPPAYVAYTKHHWCLPPVTYGHVSSNEMATLWDFEQNWLQKSELPFLHRDVFEGLVQPMLAPTLTRWNNLSKDLVSIEKNGRNQTMDAKTCREQCYHDGNCLEYSWRDSGCRLSHVLKLGAKDLTENIVSGFMLDRIDRFKQRMEPCWVEKDDPIPMTGG